MKRTTFLCFLLISSPALAQWQVTLDRPAVGRGTGVVGLKAIPRTSTGHCLRENASGAPTFQSCYDFGTTAGTVAQGNDSRIVGAAQKSANLSDLASAATSRTNLGLGTIALQNDTGLLLNAGANAGLRLNNGTVNAIMFNTTDNSISIGTVSNHPINFLTNNTTKAALDASGNFGINTSPSARLDVDGTVRLRTYPSACLTTDSNGVLSATTCKVLWAKEHFGAACDGSTNDTTAFQSLITAAQDTGAMARFSGDCRITSTLNITKCIDFGGLGPFHTPSSTPVGIASVLSTPTSVALNVISINAECPVKLHDFEIIYNAGSTGTGITLTAPTTLNQRSLFHNLFISGGTVGMDIVAASDWTIHKVDFTGVTSYALRIKDTFNVDAGDSTISASKFDVPASAVGIRWESGGGLRVSDIKINGAGAIGVDFALASGASTAGFQLTGSNIEGMTTSVRITRQGATGGFRAIKIANNKLVAGPGGRCVISPDDAVGIWNTGLDITGNYCILTGTTGTVGGFDIGTMNGVSVVGNIVDQASTATDSFAFIVGPSNTNCTIGPNRPTGTFVSASVTTCPGATVYAPN